MTRTYKKESQEPCERLKAEASSECILWTKAIRKKDGYGSTSVNGKTWPAHRWVWTQAFGPIPEGMQVLHKCDTPACVNPKHLFLGTQADNMRDMAQKGRKAKGERGPSAKLKEPDVRFIRTTRLKHSILIQTYGISKACIQKIRSRRSWAHLA